MSGGGGGGECGGSCEGGGGGGGPGSVSSPWAEQVSGDMQGNRSHYRVLMSAGRRADVVSLRSRGPIKGLMPQRPCGGKWGAGEGQRVFSPRWRGWISKQQTTVPCSSLHQPRPASPCLATCRVMSSGCGLACVCFACVMVPDLAGWPDLWEKHPATPPTSPAPALLVRATPSPPGLAGGGVPAAAVEINVAEARFRLFASTQKHLIIAAINL